MSDPQLIALEEQVSHQQAIIDDLSDMVRRHDATIETLVSRVELLLRRAAELEADGTGSLAIADSPPPHY